MEPTWYEIQILRGAIDKALWMRGCRDTDSERVPGFFVLHSPGRPRMLGRIVTPRPEWFRELEASWVLEDQLQKIKRPHVCSIVCGCE